MTAEHSRINNPSVNVLCAKDIQAWISLCIGMLVLRSAQLLQGTMADYLSPAAVQMYFENAYCINCWYKDLDQPFIKYPPFVIHYAGCQMCTGGSHWSVSPSTIMPELQFRHSCLLPERAADKPALLHLRVLRTAASTAGDF